jgi:hypothetical protein
MLRKLGNTAQGRVSGPDLTWALLGRCETESLPVYFFGSSRETLGLLAERIVLAFPNLNVVGFEAPPFRPITPEEDAESVERINTSGAGLVFVGLGWGAHALDARWTLKWWPWQYYFVVLAGRNKRALSARERQVQRLSMAIVLTVLLVLLLGTQMPGAWRDEAFRVTQLPWQWSKVAQFADGIARCLGR